MSSNRFLLIAKCILSSYALFAIYIFSTFLYHHTNDTKPTHFTYLTVDLFAELHAYERTLNPLFTQVLLYFDDLLSIVCMILIFGLMCARPLLHYGPTFALMHISMVSWCIYCAKMKRNIDPPVPVYLGLALVTCASLWILFDIYIDDDQRKDENVQDVDVEGGKADKILVDSNFKQKHNS